MAISRPILRRFSIFIVVAAATSSFSGCATIVGGGHDQSVHIDSEPKGAQVSVDGQVRGLTPMDVELSRRQDHQVQLDLQGSQPYVTTLKPGCNPWVFGNLFAGGLIGVAVDASTGAVSTLYPKEVKATFAGPGPNTPSPVQSLNASAGSGSAPSGIQAATYRSPSGLQPNP